MPCTSSQELATIPESTISIEHLENPEEDNNEDPKRSKRQRIVKSFGDDFIVYLVDDTPTSVSEAYASPDADYWKEVLRSEMDSILANGTWEITDRPYGYNPVGCKWVFKKNLRPDGTIEKYKARLVAKGYTQKKGEDFFDTYSPVARLTTIIVLLSLAPSYGLLVHQMDVKATFLNGELDEEIYMDQLDGFVVNGQEGKVCKLLKKVSLQIFSNWTKQAHDPIFHGVFQHRRRDEGSTAHTIGARPHLGAPPYGVGPRDSPTPPFRLYILPVKTLGESVFLHEKLRSRRHREAKFGTKSVRHAAGTGSAPESISIDTTAIFIAVAVSHDEEG
ncbi:hypothetical protein QYE76_049541 [Lolium multiflorum]|uniref:Reverse transcriptase Ty1/copia-type domain-containing protein n=1 Tax=Lolium multiflorum TaxID=4521 RepID=A0AAD8SPV0_LOLMU|nr:hypothetical protein QYE76_049541 [Lolium multiflorum]